MTNNLPEHPEHTSASQNDAAHYSAQNSSSDAQRRVNSEQGRDATAQQPAPQYSAPQYSAPQYSAPQPQYNNAPQDSGQQPPPPPQYAAPQYAAPQYAAPQQASYAPQVQQAPYGYAQYPQQYPQQAAIAPTEPKGKSVASFVLGLVSIVLGFALPVPIVGLVLGIIGFKQEPSAKGFSITGIVLNGMVLLLYVFLIVAGITISFIDSVL